MGVEHLVMFDHDLTDAERTTLALALTSAVAANDNKLRLGADDVNVSGKPEMLVAGKNGTHSQLYSNTMYTTFWKLVNIISQLTTGYRSGTVLKPIQSYTCDHDRYAIMVLTRIYLN